MGKIFVKRVHIGNEKYRYVLKVIGETEKEYTVKAAGFTSCHREVEAIIPKEWVHEQGFKEE